MANEKNAWSLEINLKSQAIKSIFALLKWQKYSNYVFFHCFVRQNFAYKAKAS